MARPGMMEHRKFTRLVALLGLPRSHVRGLLECMWDVGYQCGQSYLGDAVDVELAAGWTGEAGKLCAALVECGGANDAGFIEAVTGRPGRYQIHDLFDHAPAYVAGRAGRETERQKEKPCERCGTVYHSPDHRSRFCSSACRTAAWREKQGDSVTDRDGEVRHSDGLKQSDPSHSVTVTDGDGDVRHRDGLLRTVTSRNDSPAPAPAPAPNTSTTGDSSAAPAGADEPENLELTPPGSDAPGTSRGPRKRDRVSNPDVPKLIAHYVSEFERTQGARPLLQEPDAVAAAAVLRNRTYADAAVLVTTFLEQPDQFTKAHGLLRLRDLPAAVTKILARSSSARSGPKRDRTGAVIPDDGVLIEDLVGVDDEGVRRLVRVRKDGRTGVELGRTWGRAVEPEEGGDGEGQSVAPRQAR